MRALKNIWLLFFLCSVICCSSENNDDTTEQSTKKGLLTINVNELCSYDTTEQRIPLQAQIEIYRGDGTDLGTPKNGFAWNKKSNNQVAAIKWTDKDYSLTYEYETDKTYYVFVRINDDNSFCNGAYSYCTIHPTSEITNVSKTFSFNASEDDYEEWSIDLSVEKEKDFFIANWEDSKSSVKAKEKRVLINETNSELTYYHSENRTLSYKFDELGLSAGCLTFSNTTPSLNSGGVLLGYLSIVDELKSKYGDPDYYSTDIYQYEPTSDEFKDLGRSVIVKGTIITYSFKGGKVSATLWGYPSYYYSTRGGAKWDIYQDFRK